MMMTMIVFNKHVDSADCDIQYDTELGITMKKYPPITILSSICEYHPVSNNPVPVSF